MLDHDYANLQLARVCKALHLGLKFQPFKPSQ
jgi:hypothetical protein